MKNFIVTIGVLFVMIIFSVYQVDSNMLMQKQEELKYIADEAADTAALCYDDEEYGDGNLVIEDDVANAAVLDILKKNLSLDVNLKPTRGYWKDTLSYTVYYFDDSLSQRTYTNGAYVSSSPFTYGEMFEEPTTGYRKVITEPTAIVTLHAGAPRIRLDSLSGVLPDIVQTSAYEYVGY